MENKFSAVIDLEAQPLTDAVRTAISALQQMAAELDKANSTLDQAEGGMARSAAAADSLTDASANAASSMRQEAEAAKDSASAHDKHAEAAKKNADATRRTADENKRLKEAMMVGASALRMGGSIASSSGSEGLAKALDLGGSMLNAFAMRAMMGTPGMVIGGIETAGKAIDWAQSSYKSAQDRRTSIRQARAGAEYDFEDMNTSVDKAKTYNEQLRVQAALDATILSLERQIHLIGLAPATPENETQTSILEDRLNYAVRARNRSGLVAPGMLSAENANSLGEFDRMRREAIGDKAFELDLINAQSESEKIAVIEDRMKRMRAEAATLEAAARAGQSTLPRVDIDKMLDKALAVSASADALEVQLADGKRSKGSDLPSATGPNTQMVDAFWSRGLFMGGNSGGGASLDYGRRTATAAEKTAKNTERLAMLPTSQTATWGD